MGDGWWDHGSWNSWWNWWWSVDYSQECWLAEGWLHCWAWDPCLSTLRCWTVCWTGRRGCQRSCVSEVAPGEACAARLLLPSFRDGKWRASPLYFHLLPRDYPIPSHQQGPLLCSVGRGTDFFLPRTISIFKHSHSLQNANVKIGLLCIGFLNFKSCLHFALPGWDFSLSTSSHASSQ